MQGSDKLTLIQMANIAAWRSMTARTFGDLDTARLADNATGLLWWALRRVGR